METLDRPTLRILFLASSPKNQGNLRLGTELQEIRNRLSSNPAFELKDWQAVKPDDVLQTIINYKPNIVHFSGHGQNTGEICFEDENGNSKIIPPDALASLFEAVTDYVKCVLINTCFSEKQAKAISQFVPIVIGTKKEITDTAAIKFSTGFYTALDSDLSQKSLLKAFEVGRIAIRFESLPESSAPVIIQGSPEIRFSSEVDTAFLGVSKPKGLVFQALIRGLSLTGRKIGLSEDVVTQILEEKINKLELHNDGVNEYRKYLFDILRDEFPLSEISELALTQLQYGLDLTDEDVSQIRKGILDPEIQDTAEKWYDRGAGQSGIENYEKAIEYFSEAINKDPDYSAAYGERGYCHDLNGHPELAIQDFTKAIEFNNKWELRTLSWAYYSRARSYHAINTDDEDKKAELLSLSLADWDKTLKLKPNQPEGYYGRGLVYIDSGELTDAIDDFKKAYNSSADDTRKQSYALAIARCYYKLEQNDEYDEWTKLSKGSKGPDDNLLN